MNWVLILKVLTLIFFALAALGVPLGRINTIGAGLFCLAILLVWK